MSWIHETKIYFISTLLLGMSKVWVWGCVGGRFWWFSPPTLHLISWNIGHNHAKIYEFHKFWCIFDCRNNISKILPKRTISRPEGLSSADRHNNCGISAWNFTRVILRTNQSQPNRDQLRIHKLRLEGLRTKAQREDGSTFSATLSFKPETDFLETRQPFIIVLVQRRAKRVRARPPVIFLASRSMKTRLHWIFLHRPLKAIRSAHVKVVGDWQLSGTGPFTSTSSSNLGCPHKRHPPKERMETTSI